MIFEQLRNLPPQQTKWKIFFNEDPSINKKKRQPSNDLFHPTFSYGILHDDPRIGPTELLLRKVSQGQAWQQFTVIMKSDEPPVIWVWISPENEVTFYSSIPVYIRVDKELCIVHADIHCNISKRGNDFAYEKLLIDSPVGN